MVLDMTANPRPDLTVQDVAALWKVHYDTVLAEIHAGRLAAFKIRGRWRVTPAALDRYRDVHTPHPTKRGPGRPRKATP